MEKTCNKRASKSM